MKENDILEIEMEMELIMQALEGMNQNSEAAEEAFFAGLKLLLDAICLRTTIPVYKMISEHPVSCSYEMFTESIENGEIPRNEKAYTSKALIKDPKTLEDYHNNIKIYLEAGGQLRTAMKEMFGDKRNNKVISPYFDAREGYSRFVSQIENFLSNAIFLTKQGKIKSNREFLKLLTKILPSMKDSLENAARDIFSWEKYGSHYVEIFNEVKDFFSDCSGSIVNAARDIQQEERRLLEEKNKKAEADAIEKVKLAKKVEVSVSPEEAERRRLIQEANMMWDELDKYTLRDLEQMVPYSASKMYKHFIEVKYPNFLKSFKMPLSPTTTTKVACEVINQLNSLNNYISSISENAVTTDIYGMSK